MEIHGNSLSFIKFHSFSLTYFDVQEMLYIGIHSFSLKCIYFHWHPLIYIKLNKICLKVLISN